MTITGAAVVCAWLTLQGCSPDMPSASSSVPVLVASSSSVVPTAVPSVPLPDEERPDGAVSPSLLSRLDPIPACIGGQERRKVDGRGVRIAAPASRRRVPLLVAIHGYKETPDRLAAFSELDSLAVAGAAMVAYPEGSPLDLGFGWNSGARRFATRSADDVDVLRHVIDDLVGTGCADASAVYLVGESNGGGMALHAACDDRMAGRLAGVVLVNPAVDEGVLRPCVGRVPAMFVLAAVGALDRVIPVDGSREPFLAVDNWLPRVARALSTCSRLQDGPSVAADEVTVIRGLDCARCVELYESADGGHTWPGASTALNSAPIGSFALTSAIAELLDSRQVDCAAG